MSIVDEECQQHEIQRDQQYAEELEDLEGKILLAGAAANRLAVDAKNRRRHPPGNGRDQHWNNAVKKTYDALTRQVLDDNLVVQGKTAELECLRKWHVEYAEYSEAWEKRGSGQ